MLSESHAMLCLHRMAAKTQIRAEEYLLMAFEHDAEFVHGEIVQRSLPDATHSRTQVVAACSFANLSKVHQLRPCIELRMKVAHDIYRVADIAVYSARPREAYPETPPLVVVEIVSQDDLHLELMQKLEDYRQWGVPHIWVIDPARQRFSVYTELGLQNVSSFSLPGYSFQLSPAELFSDL